MAFNKCLICDTDLESFKKREIGDGHTSAAARDGHTSDSVLSDDLHVIFVLRNLFDIPREKVGSYLAANHGNPSEWKFVSFCGHCGEAVENAKRIYQEILDATKIFTAVKQEIVETVRRHWRRRKDSGTKEFGSRKTGGSISPSDKVAAKMVEETRKFIHDHDYGSLMDKDPFVDGDLYARKLCSSKLPQESTCDKRAKTSTSIVKKSGDLMKLSVHVKSEPMTSEDENDFSRLYMSPNDLEVNSELQLQPSTSLLIDDHAKPYNTSVNKNKGTQSSESVRTKGDFFKVKDLKNQRKQIHKSGPRSFMSKTLKNKAPKKYKCEFENCGRAYESQGNLTRHLLKHYENRPFHCDWPTCNSKFKKARNLRRHQLSHSDEAFVFECGFCAKNFSRKDSLLRHVKRFHFVTSQ